MPSFESLRSPRRRSAVDLLLPGPLESEAPDVPAPDVPAHDVPAPELPAPDLPAPDLPGVPAARAVVRPAEYGDLLRFATRALRAAVGVPGCLLGRLRSAVGG
jgi:hypothetical protein